MGQSLYTCERKPLKVQKTTVVYCTLLLILLISVNLCLTVFSTFNTPMHVVSGYIVAFNIKQITILCGLASRVQLYEFLFGITKFRY